jgi:redox-sensitive bicupin YhaK (pirin superfamily)
MIVVREPVSIYQVEVPIKDGVCRGRWHFSFAEYFDPQYMNFGPLRVFNDDTLSPGAVWPLHPHREIEVVTYCADGEFRHADEHGAGGVLKKGWVQHTTVGRGMWHSEINNRKDIPMRFLQMWFMPSAQSLEPSAEQKTVEKAERTNRFLPLVAPDRDGALFIFSDARVLACFLEKGRTVEYALEERRGAYLYVLEGGPVDVNGKRMATLSAAKISDEAAVRMSANADAELLLADVLLV